MGTISDSWQQTARGDRRRRRITQYLWVVFFLTPSLIGLIALHAVPMLVSLVLGVSQWNIPESLRFVGLANFIHMINDPDFFQSLSNSVYLMVGLEALNTTFGLLAALALNRRLRGISIYRTIYFLPLVTTWAAVALAWRYMYSLSGPINQLLSVAGIAAVPWLSDPSWAMPAVILTTAWKSIAWKMIILLAGLQGISPELYEASSIDGASKLQQLFKITLPLLSPALFFALVIGIINSLQLFDPIFIMTAGGPADSTRTLGYYIYTTGFQDLNMGYAAAMSWALLVIILCFTLVQWYLQKKWVFYE
ncbi:MAG TPA: sugar ABC transporter permease [Chloroflexota bacterium]|nr:sugar ABC transporter permease [Chloroflexota bacterium]